MSNHFLAVGLPILSPRDFQAFIKVAAQAGRWVRSENGFYIHWGPDQGVELRFQAKAPGPAMALQKVNMRFDYSQAFTASRAIGYEVLLYNCMNGDATLFSRTDLVETAWRIAQPILDFWKTEPAEFPNYAAGTWGPKDAFALIERDGRRWVEILNRETLEKVPLFHGGDAVLLSSLILALKPVVFPAGELILKKGDLGRELYLISRGEVEVVDSSGKVTATLGEGDFFGEIGLLLSAPRTANVRARSHCDLFVLEKSDFARVLRDRPQFVKSIMEIAMTRYNITTSAEKMLED